MALTNADITFEVLFSPAADRKSGTVTITSTTDFASFGISLSDAAMAINAWAPDTGQFKTGNLGSPDVADESVTRSFTFDLPRDVNGFVQEGDYQFQLLERIIGGVDTGDYNSAKLVSNLCIECPIVVLNPTVDVNCGLVTGTDATDYSGWTLVSRTLTLSPPRPYTVTHNPITSTSFTVDTSGEDIFNGTYSLYLDAVYTKDSLQCTIATGIEFDASGFDVCALSCCYESVWADLEAARANGYAETIQRLEYVWEQSVLLLSMIQVAAECGRTDQLNEYTTKIQKLTGCTSGCGCADGDVPTRIVPFCTPGGGSAITVQDDGVYTLVTLSGTTYTVSLTQVQKDILNNTYNTVVTSSDSSVTVTTSTDTSTTPDTTTYDLAVAGDPQIDWMQIVLIMTFTNGNPTPSGALSSFTIRGSKFQAPTSIVFNTSTPDSLEIGGFYVGTPGKFIVRIDDIDITYDSGTTSGTYLQDYADMKPTQHTWSGTNIARFGLYQVYPTVGGYDTWFRWGNIFDEIKIVLTFTEVP